MKERIVLTGKIPKNFYINSDDIIATREQVPESFAELKELCLELNNKIKDISVNCVYNEHILIQWYNDDNTDIDIYKDGTIFVENHLVADNRTPQQMWQIIKALIGEQQ